MDGHLNFSRDHSRLLASSGLHAAHSFSMEATHPHGSTMRTAFADLGRPSTGVNSATADPTALTAAALQSRFLSAALPFTGASTFPFLGGMLTSSMPASPSSPFRTPPASVTNMRQFWPPTPPPDGYGRFNMSGNFYNLLPSMGSLVPPSDSMPYSGHGMISRLTPSTHYHHLLDAHKDSSYFSPNLNLGAPLTPTTLVPPLSSFSPAIDRQSTFGHLSPGMKGMDTGRRPLGGAEESNANSFWRMDAELEGFLKRETPSRHSSTERSAKQQQQESPKEPSKRSSSEKRESADSARKASSGNAALIGSREVKGSGEIRGGCKSSRDAAGKAERRTAHSGSAGGDVKCSTTAVEGLPVFSSHSTTSSKPVDQPPRSTPLQQLPASIPTEPKAGSECSRNIGGGHYPQSDGIVERRVPTSATLGVSKVVGSQTPPVVTMTTTAATSNTARSATTVTYSHALRIQEPRDCRPSSEKQQIRVPATATTPVSSAATTPVSFLPLSSSCSPPVINQTLSVTVPLNTSGACAENSSIVSVKCSCASSPKPPPGQPVSLSVSDAVVHKNNVNSSSVQCSKVCTVNSCALQSTTDSVVYPLCSASSRTSSETSASKELTGPQSAAINLSLPSQIVTPSPSSSVSKPNAKGSRKDIKRNSPVPHGVASVYTSQQWTHQSPSDPHLSHSYSSWDMGNPSTPQCPKSNPRNTSQISSQCCKNIESKNLSGNLPVVSSKEGTEKSFSVDAIKLKKESDDRRQDCQFAQKSQLSSQRLTGSVCSDSVTLRPNTDSDDNNCAINLTVGNKVPKSEPKDYSLCNQHNQQQQPQPPPLQQDTALVVGSTLIQRTRTIATTSSNSVSTSVLSTSMSTVSDSRGNRQKSIVQGSPISWIAPQVQSRTPLSIGACSNKPVVTAVQPVSTITSSQRTTGRAVKEVHSTIASKHPHSAKTHTPVTIKSNLSNRTRAETTISRLCRNATISSTLDGSVKIATPGGEMNMLQQSAKTTTITLPGGVVAATANTSIPIGIAVAQQRQDPSNASAGVKHNPQPPVSTDNLQRFTDARPLDNSNVCDQSDLLRSQKANIQANMQESLTRPAQGLSDSTNCLVSTGTALQTNQWDSEAVTRTTLPTQWVTHTPVVTPTVWVGQGAYAPAPANTATTVPTVSLGPLDTSHLSIPPGGYQLARDPITGHLFLIPTANIVSHTELVDRTSMWSTYTTTTAPVHLQQLVTQPQQQTQFQQQIVAQMETGKLQVTELTESTVCTITVSDTVEGRDRERESQQSQELVAKRESKDTKAVGTSPSTLIAGIPIATGQPFTYSTFPAPAPAPAVSYYYEPTVVHLTQNQATTAIQTEPGKRSQGTSPLNPATPSPPLQIASEQAVQTCSPEDNIDELEDFDDCDRDTHMEVTHVKSGHEMGVTTATQVDFDAQTSSEDNDFEERKVEVQDSANQTESPLIGTPKDELLDDSSTPFESIEQESNALETENIDTKSCQVTDDIVEKEKCNVPVTDDVESAPILPAESEPVMEFIDHHGLNLLVDSIEEFTAREQEAHHEPQPEEKAESQKESPLSSCNDKQSAVNIQPASESTPSLPRLDPGCTDGLGLLCALAEQRFIEESLNAQQKSKELVAIQSNEKTDIANSVTKLDINSNYQSATQESSVKKCTSHVQGRVSSSPARTSSSPMHSLSTSDNKDPTKVEMKVQLAELQRKYKRKQKELVRMQSKKEEPVLEVSSLQSQEIDEPPKKKKKVEDVPLSQDLKITALDSKKSKPEEMPVVSKMVVVGPQHQPTVQTKTKKSETVSSTEGKKHILPTTMPSSLPLSTTLTPKSSRPSMPVVSQSSVTTVTNSGSSWAIESLSPSSSLSSSSSSSASCKSTIDLTTKKEQTNKVEVKCAPMNSNKSIQPLSMPSSKIKMQSLKPSHDVSKKPVDNKRKLANTQVNAKLIKTTSATTISFSVKKETETSETKSANVLPTAELLPAKESKEHEQSLKKGVKRPVDSVAQSGKPLKTVAQKSKEHPEIKTKKLKTEEGKKAEADNKDGKAPVFNEDAWNRRRSERIFLHDAGVVPQSSVASYNDIPVIGQKPVNPPPSQTKTAEAQQAKTDNFASAKVSKPASKVSDQSNKPKKPKQPKKEVTVIKKIKNKEIKEPKTQEKEKEKEQKETKSVPDDLFTALKKCRVSEGQTCGLSPANSDAENVEASSSEGENIPLSALADRYASELRSSTVTCDDLKDNQRVLTLVDGLFYAGAISAIQPPDIYGIVLDGERGNRPRIYSQEEILKEAILEIKPTMMKHLPEGCRVCAYWSQQYRCLYPGTVAKATSPNPAADKNLVYVEFDDGDSGKIPLEDIRLLPADYPVVEVEPNPLLLLGKRRQRTGESTESKTSSTDCMPLVTTTEKPKVKKIKKQIKSTKKKTSSNMDELKQDSTLCDDVFHSKSLKSQSSKHSSGDKNCSSITSASPSCTPVAPTMQTTVKAVSKTSAKDSQDKLVPKKKSKKSKNDSKVKSKEKSHEKNLKNEALSIQDSKSKKHKKHKDDHKHRHRRHHRHCRHRHRHKKHKHDKKNVSSSGETHVASSSSSSSSSPLVNSSFSTASLSSSIANPPLSLSSPQPSTPALLTSSPHKNTTQVQKASSDAKNQPEVSNKKSELTVKIKTSISELTCASETTGAKEQKCKTAVVVDESSSDSSSDSSDTSDSSEDEAPSSEVRLSSNSKKTSKTATQKSKNNKSSASQKPAKRRDRIPSVEKSKIAAFLPARQLWRWSGKSFRRPGTKGKAKKEFYKEITRGKETIRVGDSAVFLSTGRPHLPYIGRIETMWQSWGGNMVVKVRWFYHPEETKGEQRLSDPKGALFESPHMDENDVQTISHKCEVLSWEDYNKHKEQEANRGSIYGSIFDNNDIYYLAGTYDPTVGVVVLKPGIT